MPPSFLFIDFQADKSENKKLRNEKQGFLLQNYHRRKTQASILRLKATQTAATEGSLLIKSPTSEQSASENEVTTGEQGRWLDKIQHLRRTSGQAAFGSDIWSLNAYLGQGYVDPFEVSAMKMTSSMNMYFHHFRIHTTPACYPVDATRMSMWWWQKAIQQPVVLQTLLFSTAGHQAKLETSSGVSPLVVKKSLQDSLRLRGDTLKTLNDIMKDPIRAAAESTLLVVASLAAIEAVDGNIEISDAHMRGLKRLVQLVGGLDTIEHMTLSKVYQSDIKSAILSNTRPFSPISARWKSEIVQGFRLHLTPEELDMPKDLASLGVAIFSSSWYTKLDRSMKVLFQVMRRLIIYYEHAQRNPASVMPTDNDLFIVAEHQILCSRYKTTDLTDINEPLRFTLLIYLNLRITSHSWNMSLRISDGALTFHTPHLQSETPELLFWILVLGSLASQGFKCHRWYLNRLIEMAEQLGLSEWDEARAIMGRFFYTDQASEKRAEDNLWNEVLLRETYAYIAPKR
ncbi:hypothetical protein F1880_008549 [Penicillium rolfsii]|nr:hypothetical protein F1880_008549 [Penicillium rolfsii]